MEFGANGDTGFTAMTFDTIFTVKPEHVARLDLDDAVRFTAEILWAEAARLRLPSTAVSISFRTNVPDGGVDASVDVDVPPEGSVLRSGMNVIQVKAGDFKPWQKGKIGKELFGKEGALRAALGQPIRACMDAGGRYVLLCTGVDLTPQQRDQAMGALRQAFVGCGYTDPRIDVIGQAQLIGVLGPFPSLCFALNGNGLGYFDTLRTWATQDQMQYKFKAGEAQRKFMVGLARRMRASEVLSSSLLTSVTPRLGSTYGTSSSTSAHA